MPSARRVSQGPAIRRARTHRRVLRVVSARRANMLFQPAQYLQTSAAPSAPSAATALQPLLPIRVQPRIIVQLAPRRLIIAQLDIIARIPRCR